jgi:hypothetical protein
MRKVLGALVLVTLAACGGGDGDVPDRVPMACAYFVTDVNVNTEDTDAVVADVRAIADAETDESSAQLRAKHQAQAAVSEIDSETLGEDTLQTLYEDCLARRRTHSGALRRLSPPEPRDDVAANEPIDQALADLALPHSAHVAHQACERVQKPSGGRQDLSLLATSAVVVSVEPIAIGTAHSVHDAGTGVARAVPAAAVTVHVGRPVRDARLVSRCAAHPRADRLIGRAGRQRRAQASDA